MDDAPPPDAPETVEPATRDDLEQSLRFLHVMSMQTKLNLEQVDALASSLFSMLTKAGVIDPETAKASLAEAQQDARERNLTNAHVKVGPAPNKYGVPSPDVDCAALMPLCKARCCRLTVHLSFQDLDEGLRWEYPRPYELRRRPTDGYCIYSDAETRQCGVYRKRPGVCRSYDCRTDQRVWDDFERRIPAPMEKSDPPLLTIRLPVRDP